MRWHQALPWIAWAAGGIAALAAAPPIEDTVNQAINNFEPLWKPPREQLRGWTVGIDPAGAGAAGDRRHVCDALDLLTAEYLYHFVIRAGGSPVLSRADGAPPAQTQCAARARTLRRAGCEVVISIRHTDSDTRRVTPIGAAGGLGRDLAQCVAHALSAAPETAAPFSARPPAQPNDPAAAEEAWLVRPDDAVPACAVTVGVGASRRVTADTRRACYETARRLYAGLAAFCARQARGDSRQAVQQPVPDCPTPQRKAKAAQLARTIWPDGPLPPGKADWFCQRYAQLAITNRSLVYFDVRAQEEGGTIVLSGRTNFPRIAAGLSKTLRVVTTQRVRSEITRLPDRARLGERAFGVCQAPMVLTFGRPAATGDLQTELLLGEPLVLLDRCDGYDLVQAGDGYWGWVRQDAVKSLTPAEFDAYVNRPRGVLLEDVTTGQWMLPRGAGLPVTGRDGDRCTVLLPDGTTCAIPAAAIRLTPGAREAAAERVRAALDLLYTPYVFGGRSPLGLDCSGMVTNVVGRAGRRPARDAWQQVLAGRLVATAWHRGNIRPGDQVFFINEYGKVYHTGIALDATHVIHASPPCVQINSLDPNDPLYDRTLDRCFFVAKRP